MPEKLRVGVVGCGEIAQLSHIPSLCSLSNVNLAAICDRDESVAEAVARRFRIKNYYTDVSLMLNKENLDMMDVCATPETHASLSILAMEAGCHVLVEKPMATSSKQADEMISSSIKNKVTLGVVHNNLFNPVIMKAKSLVERGDIGDVIGVDIKFPTHQGSRYLNKDHWCHKLPGGIYTEILAHPIYLAQEFLGDVKLAGVYAEKLGNDECLRFDEVRIILKGKKGFGMITNSYSWPQGIVTVDVFGTKMHLHADIGDGVIIKYGGLGENRVHKVSARAMDNLSQGFQRIAGVISSGGEVLFNKHYRYISHYILIRGFVESLQNNLEPPVTAQAGRENVKIMEEITNYLENMPTEI
jgi:predicted dehydrogenase